MGADQGWGKVVYELEQYVQASDNKEVLKIFKNKADDKWYYKNHLNEIFLLFGDGCCDYVDYMQAKLLINDNDVNYLPKTPMYGVLGVIDANYFGDLLHANTLANNQAFKNYNNSTFNGAFTIANLNNINGKITIPSNGFYQIAAKLTIDIEPSSNIGIGSITSQNPKMLGEICSICFVDKEDKQLQKHTLKNGKTIFLCNKCSRIIA